MKTSNKILLFIGISLCASTFINAYILKQKVKNKEYTLATNRTNFKQIKTEPVNILPTDSIHIIGGKVLTVEIIKSDSASIEKEQGTDVEIFKENGKLIIKTPDPANASSQYSGHVMIKIPSLKAVSFEKKSIIRKAVNKNQTRSSEYSLALVINIKGFTDEKLNINGLAGGGNVTLQENNIATTVIKMDAGSEVTIDSTNTIQTLTIKSKDNSAINLLGAKINYLNTEMSQSSTLNINGRSLKGILSTKIN